MRLITVEFTEDTFRDEVQTDADGNVVLGEDQQPVVERVKVRSAGDRLHVDPRSARSFCDIKKVAKRVGSTTDDDRSNDQIPAQTVTGDVDTPPSEQQPGDQPTGETPSGETDAAGSQSGEQAATPRRSRGSNAGTANS